MLFELSPRIVTWSLNTAPYLLQRALGDYGVYSGVDKRSSALN